MNKKKALKLAAVITAGIMCMMSTAGCGDKKQNDIPASTQAAKDGIGSITSEDGLYRYYVYETASKYMYAEPGFDGNVSVFDWTQQTDGGMSLDERIKREAYSELAVKQLLMGLAEENGVKLSEDELKKSEEAMASFREQQGDEMFNLNLKSLGMSSVEEYNKFYKLEATARMVEEDFAKNPVKYIGDNVKLEDYTGDGQVTAQHILIQNNSDKHDNPKETIEEVLKKARAGEDFTALLNEYNEDPGETEKGYTFGKGEMVKAFEDAAFALKCGEISDVVETEYGYHIIKRLAGFAEYKTYLLENMDRSAEDEFINKFSVRDIMTDISNAETELAAKEAANSGGGTNE